MCDICNNYLYNEIHRMLEIENKAHFIHLSSSQRYKQVNLFQKHSCTHDDRLFIELEVQYMKIASSEHVNNMLCTKIVLNVKTKTKNIFCTQHVLDMF